MCPVSPVSIPTAAAQSAPVVARPPAQGAAPAAVRATLGHEHARPLREAVLLVPAGLAAGPARAVADLEAHLRAVTGKPVFRVTLRPGVPAQLPPASTHVSVFAVGNVRGWVPAAPGPQGFAISGGTRAVGGQARHVVGVAGGDDFGLQHGIYRLMELTGARFFSYTDTYTPPVGQAVAPAAGFSLRHQPPAWLKTRGFAPHLYHPIPLSTAFHEPSPAHLEVLKRYVDWHVQNGQNYMMMPMLELDQKHPLLPLKDGQARFEAWLPHARALLEYAHARGVKVAVKLAFANYVSSNAFAINPVTALWQSFKLDGASSRLRRANTPAEKQAAQEAYDRLLARYRERDRPLIEAAIDKYMRAPWDEIVWNLGTSEFTPTSDDLTIAWMNDAAAHLQARYPGVETSVRSHVPSQPRSEKYDESYYNLYRFADPAVGAYVHTTHAYGLTDPAPVYGNEDFTHKLEALKRATPERRDIYYPETSYWVAHDVSVPLFLPVYLFNRKRDMDLVKQLPHLDGHVGFTTGWEWGYWLNDYALARMQSDPDESLESIVAGALGPLGAASEPMAALMIEVMRTQKEQLLDGNMIRHLQGFDTLTDFGARAGELPVVKDLLHGANAQPIRLRADQIARWSAAELVRHEQGELAALARMSRAFDDHVQRAEALRAQVPGAGRPLFDELTDGLAINALRTRQVVALQQAAVLARRGKLTGDPALARRAEQLLARARATTAEAEALIRRREARYREAPAYTTARGTSDTLWPDRYLTPVHTLKYWRNSYDEVARALGRPAYAP
jgi:hypothetical protein